MNDFSKIAFAALYWKMINGHPESESGPPDKNDSTASCGCIALAAAVILAVIIGSCSGKKQVSKPEEKSTRSVVQQIECSNPHLTEESEIVIKIK